MYIHTGVIFYWKVLCLSLICLMLCSDVQIFFLALLMCPNVFWPVYVAILLMPLQSAGCLLKKETSERQVPLPAVSQAFHFSNRTWKHMAGWWKRVERETWVKADLSIIFSFSISDFILYEIADDFECIYTIIFLRRSLTGSVNFYYILFNNSWMEIIHLDWLLDLFSWLHTFGLSWSSWVWTCCFFTIRSGLWSFLWLSWDRFSLTPTGCSHSSHWPSDAYCKHKMERAR